MTNQCESNVAYALGTDSNELAFFTNWVGAALDEAGRLSNELDAPKHPIIQEAIGATIEFVHVKYGQLKHIAHPKHEQLPPPINDDQYRPDQYVMYELDDKRYAINPSGYHYEIVSTKSWPYTVEYVCTVDLGGYNDDENGEPAELVYAVRLTCRGLPIEYQQWHMKPGCVGTPKPYLDLKLRQHCIRVEYGEMFGNSFQPWTRVFTSNGLQSCNPPCIYVGDNQIVRSLSRQEYWKPPADEEEVDEIVAAPLVASAKYTLDTINDELCLYFKRGKDEGIWMRCANFAIDHVVSILEFHDSPEVPIFRLKVHRVIDDSKEGTLYLLPEHNVDVDDTQDCGRLEAEVNVAVGDLRDAKDVCAVFSRASSLLLCEDNFTPGVLNCYLNNIRTTWPRPTRVCTYFGLQDKSDLFVMGNCVFRFDGSVKLLDESSVTIYAEYFDSDKNKMLKMPKSDFPRVLLVPQPWVRYTLFFSLWKHYISTMFLNNEMPAKCMFATAVMQIHASKFWNGEAIGHGLASAWAKSTAPGTGVPPR